jgi:hypothetical protein
MFKATHKRRATTLSKTLLTAGLLGGAALSTLSAGSAQAAWDPHDPITLGYICKIAPIMGAACEKAPAPGATTPTTVPIPTPPDKTTYPNDKRLTLLDWDGLVGEDAISFVKQPLSWEVNIDFATNISAPSSGFLTYKLEITDPDWYFDVAALSTLLSPVQPLPLGDFTVTKGIYTDAAFTDASKLFTLTNNEVPSPAGTLVANNVISPDLKTIYVRDTWDIPAGSNITMDAIQNNYTQRNEVPAPLPLLGVGAAFGSIRKLRKFSSQLKTFSMG